MMDYYNLLLKKDDSIMLVKEDDKKIIQKLSKENPKKSLLYIDYAKVVTNIKRLRQKYPNLKLYYKTSSNSDELLLYLLSNMDVKFSCFNINDIAKVEKINVNAKILLSNPIITKNELEEIKNKNYFNSIEYIICDCKEQVELIKEAFTLFPKPKLILQYNSIKNDDNSRFGNTFQCLLEMIDIIQKENFSLGGMINTEASSETDFNLSNEVLNYIFTKKLHKKEVFSLFLTEHNYKFTHPSWLSVPPSLILSSSIAGNFIISMERIILKKSIEKDKSIHYHLEKGSIYDSSTYEDSPEYIPSEKFLNKTINKNERYKCDFFGPTCDSFNYIVKNHTYYSIPRFEHIIFENCGVNTISFGFHTFNGFDTSYVEKKFFNLNNLVQ